MAIQWVRLWLDMPTDPKWRIIAKEAGQPISLVISLYIYLMTEAGNATKRGETQCNATKHVETYAAAFDEKIENIQRILDAMQGRVLAGNVLTGWEKRQPKREDRSTERVRKYRETQCNAMKRNVTLDKDKDKDKDKTTFSLFWKAYPKKVGKGAAEKAWGKIKCPGATLEVILSALASQTISPQWQKDNGQYIPNPATWLNQKRWEDEPVKITAKEPELTQTQREFCQLLSKTQQPKEQ